MKRQERLLLICFLAMVCLPPIFANEECDEQLQYAKKLYNAGKYQDAKDNFDYVQKICGPTYGSVDKWITKCNEALNPAPKKTSQSSSSSTSSSSSNHQSSQPTLSVSETYIYAPAGGVTKYLTVTSNRSWEIEYSSGTMYSVTRSGNGVTVTIKANTATNPRADYFNIKTVDGTKTIKIDMSQAAGSSSGSSASSSSSSSNSSSAYLTLSKTNITASASGTTEYITVSSNTTWEIQYPSASMYTVTKLSNTSIKVVINKNTGGSRQDFFNIITTDESKKVKVSLSQGQGSSSYSSSSNYNSSSYRASSYRNNSGYAALNSFNQYNGKCEVDWLTMRASIGTGVDIDMGLFGVRYSVLKIEPAIIGIRYDFIRDYFGFYYQPDIKLVFPWNSYCAFEFGVGPSINVNLGNDDDSYSYSYYGGYSYSYKKKSSYPNVWFTTEVGILLHWGDVGSSDFFLRYDGIFSVGVSCNFSTGF